MHITLTTGAIVTGTGPEPPGTVGRYAEVG